MDVKKLVSQMTLEEKASLCSGSDFWHTQPIERLNIPAVMVSDGPHGLRKQAEDGDHLGINDSISAVCFPCACATAASFDRDLLKMQGEAIGEECQAENVGVVLGPAVNIKRSPLCGRNFEYFSEDPYLTAEAATAYVQGVQSKNVGTSVKHFVANNQEHRRMSSSSQVDERTMRELYLPAFEMAVRNGKAWTIMCSYNRINGVFASENREYMTDVLRGEWGFDGYVMTDWGAIADRVTGIEAGIDLEMPSSNGINDEKIVQAVKAGKLDERFVDLACERVLTVNYRYLENAKPDTVWDKQAHHELAADIAAECMVLLKNENGILPLRQDDEIAFIGEFAQKPRYQGGGSSHINSFKTQSALQAIAGMQNVRYAKGFDIASDSTTTELLSEAVDLAKKARVAVVFAGLPDSYESEGYDRTHMRLPACQNELIERVCAANPNTVVVLHNGSPVEMPWVDRVKAILELYLGGQAVGAATVRVLFGMSNPSGRLPESFPIKLEHNPSYLFYGGEKDVTEYREGIFVGYRYYDKKKMDVLFEFGYGLSYTTFDYSSLRVSKDAIADTETVSVSVDVRNTGKVFGKEVVQLYVADTISTPIRPVRELKGFEKVGLAPGQSKTVTFVLDKRAFAYWNIQLHDWHVESGEYELQIGKSSRDIVLTKTIHVASTTQMSVRYDQNSIFTDIMEDPTRKRIVEPLMNRIAKVFHSESDDGNNAAHEAISDDMVEAMLRYMPLRAALSFGEGAITLQELEELIDRLNA